MSDGDEGILAALKEAASPPSEPGEAGDGGAEAAFERYKEKGDLASFRELVDALLDEGEDDEDEE